MRQYFGIGDSQNATNPIPRAKSESFLCTCMNHLNGFEVDQTSATTDKVTNISISISIKMPRPQIRTLSQFRIVTGNLVY